MGALDGFKSKPKSTNNARQLLTWVALFLGELRDGLTMINMQSAFLITSKEYSEKQVGLLFFVFGMAQFIFQTPAGYIMDYSDKKVLLLSIAGFTTTVMTILTAMFALPQGQNLGLMVVVKFFQGAITALIPPGLNSITQGIVGAVGMTQQVSRNEMMNHLGTAIIVLTASITAFALYPDIGSLFIVSPIACAGFLFFLNRIKPEHIDHNAARGLTTTSESPDIVESQSSSSLQNAAAAAAAADNSSTVKSPTGKKIKTTPSFNFGFGDNKSVASSVQTATPKAETPMEVFRDPILLLFTVICFMFHMANGCVLPLVMQSLALGNGRSGILMSGLCIIVAQTLMVASAKICGDYSTNYGRKGLFLIGLCSVPVRCLIITGLLNFEGDDGKSTLLQMAILSTQVLDGVGAGTFGTMYILVTSDISGGTGRFSLTLGITTAAMNIGGTVSGYLGEMLAQDLGYRAAFMILGTMSLIPCALYFFFMPETLPAYAVKRAPSMAAVAEGDEEDEGYHEGESPTKYTLA